MALLSISNTKRSGVSFPKPTETSKAKAAAATMAFTPGASPDTLRVQSPDGSLALADEEEVDEYGYAVEDDEEVETPAPTTGDPALDKEFEAALMALPLLELKDIEAEAERNFRRSKSITDMINNEIEWRFIERVYLKRLSNGETAKLD